MNFFQIWIGDKPSKTRMKCIRSVLRKLDENDKYVLISTDNFLKNYRKKYQYEYINIYEYVKQINGIDRFLTNKIYALTDVIRYHFLSVNKNSCYCDTDLYLKEKPYFKDKVYFPKYGLKTYDCFFIYNGSNLKFFNDLLNLIIKEDINIIISFATINLRKFRMNITPINKQYYIHYNMWVEENGEY